ncbi:uncharacterized protein N7496_011655 [Penicillium cataractarum]|uniref:Integrase catalytic domain-containing protein n=1 Tax=Penicillium cataractarum TaxID=2100454 RepID=A0A9W9RFE1_9EURO|nr:uncharacterized protein N7496_011655 [Penicillium cataractarum]KAJ5359242.1 hypothetical protein N7496_011655 [Penicillium cataractarum]
MESTVISAMKGEKLKDPLQWRNWFARIKLYARQKRVWDLIDPHTEEGYLEEPIRRPRRPQYPEDGNESAKREWRDRMDIYKLDLSEWEQQSKSLDAVNEWIITNLDPIHHTSMLNYQTPYERLVYLHTRFGRATAAEEDVRTQWKRVSALPPRKGADIDQWINEWDSLREQGVSLDLPEIKNANKDFLRAVKDLLPMWWQSKFEAIVLHQEEWDTRDLIENFRGTYREIHPQRSTVSTISKASFSTLQGFEEAKQEDQQQAQALQPQQPRSLPPIPKRWCPCGNKAHKPWDCWIINREAFPDKPVLRWKVKRVEERLSKDEAWKTWIDKMVKDHNEKNGVNNTKTANSTQLWGSYFTSFPIEQVYQSVKAAGGSSDDTRKRWFLDTASSVHVCNQRDLFTKFTPKADNLRTGDSSTAVEGIGSAIMTGIGPDGSIRPIQLSNVVYSPGFHANLMSYAALKEKGVRWDEDNECIKDSAGEPIVNVRLIKPLKIWGFDQPNQSVPDTTAHAYAVGTSTSRTSVKPLVAEASADRWHRRLAHVSKRVVKKATEMVDGIQINEDLPDSSQEEEERELCQICNLASAPRQISRRPIGRSFGKYGRIHFDLVQFPPGYNGHQWMTHFYVEGIRFHWLYTHERKYECREAVRRFIALVKNWWNLPIKAFHYDNELSAGAEAERFLSHEGIVVSQIIPYHSEQNGPAERSGGVILTKSRHLHIESKLPKELWPEMVSTAAWILNRIPTYLKDENRWIVPWDEARQDFGSERMKKANLANLRVYGSLTYCRIRKIPRLQKISPRAEVGFLVGYVASNIWKVWFPSRGKVEVVRDARFDESRRWRPDMQYWQEIALPAPEPTILTDEEHLDVLREDLGIPEEPSTNRNTEEDRQQDHDEAHQEDPLVSGVEEGDPTEATAEPQGVVTLITPEPDERDRLQADQGHQTETLPGSFPIEEPPILPPSPAGDQSTTASPTAAGQGVDNQPISQATNQRSCLNEDQPPEPEIPLESLTEESTQEEEDSLSDSEQQLHTELHTRRSDGIDTANILEGSRRRRPRVNPDYHAYATIQPAVENEPPELLRTFAAALYTEKPIQRHRDDLPPRALYGLRISPKLWQQEASRVLEKLGLTPIPEDPCVFVSHGIIVFFYVDDILIANHPSVREKAKQLEKDLEAHWELTDHGEAEWFLNIRIIRDRREYKLWLCQDAYISSMAARYNLTDRPPVYTPLPVEEMKPYDGTATPAEIKLYQGKRKQLQSYRNFFEIQVHSTNERLIE